MRRLTQLSPKRNEKREHSSVGSERLPYKQRVGGSTPSAPTTRKGIFKSSCRNATAFLLYPAAVSGDPRPGKQNLIIRKKIFRSERPVCRENFVNSAPMGNMAAARPYRLVVHLPYNLCFTCYIIDL